MDHVDCLKLALKLVGEGTQNLQHRLWQLESKPPFVSYWGPGGYPEPFNKRIKEHDELLKILSHSLATEHNLFLMIEYEKTRSV